MSLNLILKVECLIPTLILTQWFWKCWQTLELVRNVCSSTPTELKTWGNCGAIKSSRTIKEVRRFYYLAVGPRIEQNIRMSTAPPPCPWAWKMGIFLCLLQLLQFTAPQYEQITFLFFPIVSYCYKLVLEHLILPGAINSFLSLWLVPRNECFDNETVQFARRCGQSSTICTTGKIILKEKRHQQIQCGKVFLTNK